MYADTIPLGGNAYAKLPAIITDSGLLKWSNSTEKISIYFRTDVAQTLDVSLKLKVPEGKSEISISANNSIIKKQITNPQFEVIKFGNLNISSKGYVKIDLTGISRTGDVFADVSDLIIQYKKKDSTLVYVKKGSSFHFGRRGPSVHLRYLVPDSLKTNIHWFYNEIEVPAGYDKIGSYFMADGFGEGYFGMQVNSNTERRVLFSVWSAFETDDPSKIPDSSKIILLKKGKDVVTNNFGNEGSGGQSFLRFNWKCGNTYAFLTGAIADTIHHTTTYSAYFKDVQANKWFLIACFKRPQTLTYLTNLYSFLENFEPETGDETREGWYKNEWIMDGRNNWHELTNAMFSVDATAKAGYRKDYGGGAAGNYFYLHNTGFFNRFTKPGQVFKRLPSLHKPNIDFKNLPDE